MALAFRLIGVLAVAAATLTAYASDFATIPFEERMRQAERIAANLRVDGHAQDWRN
jgi:hypothetical protein